MPWSVLLGGACGALGAVVAALVIRDRSENPIGYLVVMLVVFAVSNAASRQLVLPRLQAWEARTVAEKLLRENKLLSLMSSDHPEVGLQFEAMMVELVRSGASTDVARARGVELGRKIGSRYFGEYAARASDEALVSFASVFVATLEQLDARDGEGCYAWLWPTPREQSAPALTLAEAQSFSAAMGDVVESALEAPRPAPSASEADALRGELMDRLTAIHGEDFSAAVALLGHPLDAGVDRARACMAATEIYRGALQMPEGKRGSLLRALFHGAPR